ncbi:MULTISPECIES: hypothetical protein [unclassified Nocardia]|uniref:hypothetical protein n=1 Tax=unclassified Nocardia TaxID=2637762 RepID=UPI0035E1350A
MSVALGFVGSMLGAPARNRAVPARRETTPPPGGSAVTIVDPARLGGPTGASAGA